MEWWCDGMELRQSISSHEMAEENSPASATADREDAIPPWYLNPMRLRSGFETRCMNSYRIGYRPFPKIEVLNIAAVA